MKLLFHAGLNKAGSTYLQNIFSLNSKILLEKGIFYPKLSDSC